MTDNELRTTLAGQLRQSRAHAGLAKAVEGLPAELAGRMPEGFRHTAWQQVEHLRIAAEDLVAYCRDARYEALAWPEGYWPTTSAPPSAAAWHDSVRQLLAATEAMARLAEDAQHDLFAKVPSATDRHHHSCRAALILLDHNGYHAGQLVALRIALGAWPTD